jgi:hypothetical protein
MNPKRFKSVVNILKEAERAQKYLVSARALYDHHKAWKRSECGIAAAEDANGYMEAAKLALDSAAKMIEEAREGAH